MKHGSFFRHSTGTRGKCTVWFKSKRFYSNQTIAISLQLQLNSGDNWCWVTVRSFDSFLNLLNLLLTVQKCTSGWITDTQNTQRYECESLLALQNLNSPHTVTPSSQDTPVCRRHLCITDQKQLLQIPEIIQIANYTELHHGTQNVTDNINDSSV